MSKRFTETTKWDKPWFFELSPKMKLAWLYLCDRCNHAGIWDANFKLMEIHLGFKITKQDLDNALGDKLFWINNTKLYLTTFIEFQYKTPLNPQNKVHASIFSLLSSYQIKEGTKGLGSPLLGAKDKEKDKDKDKDKEKEKDETVETEIRRKELETAHENKDAESQMGGHEILFELWNKNRGPLPSLKIFSDERKRKAKQQFAKYPDQDHWLDVLERWRESDFCLNKWRPNFDDWLSEKLRIKTLEGKYDNRQDKNFSSLCGQGSR